MRRAAALLFLPGLLGLAQVLPLPPRAASAPGGREFAAGLRSLSLREREQAIYEQILGGNVPAGSRRLVPVHVTAQSAGTTRRATFWVSPDYLAVGSEPDYFLAPLSPATAQRIAERLGCILPTRRMVDAIYGAAEVKLAPDPIPPSAAMTTVPVFAAHNDLVWIQRSARLETYPWGALVAGHKKDLVLSPRLADAPGKVAIYGWHRTNGVPIQPLYLGHTSIYVDYSHGVRLVQQDLVLDGVATTVARVLADPACAGVLSDEGPIAQPRYPMPDQAPSP